MTKWVRNVYERHSNAFYINIPISHKLAKAFTDTSILTPSLDSSNQTYLQIVVDDLDILRFYVANYLPPVPTPFTGLMLKVNVLVEEKGKESDAQNNQVDPSEKTNRHPGYQICGIAFEENGLGFGTYLKTQGAKSTQKIPAASNLMKMNQVDNDITIDVKNILTLRGEINPHALTESDITFYTFSVLSRDHKYLLQNGQKITRAWVKLESSIEGVKRVQLKNIDTKGLQVWLKTILRQSKQVNGIAKAEDVEELLSSLSFEKEKLRCFLAPQYIITDHMNKTFSNDDAEE
eukprot:g385.t1